MARKPPSRIVDLKKEFGRVVSHPGRHRGQPFLYTRNIPVLNVLNMIAKGLSDQDIINATRAKIDQNDIDACRSYQARFLTETLTQAFQLQNHVNCMMIDENVSYMVLHDVVRLFGRSSHVYADGLYWTHNDDEKDIWNHLIDNGYKAILTSDDDFKRISRNWRRHYIETYGSVQNGPQKLPVVISMSKQASRENIRQLLTLHQNDIRRYMQDNDCAYASINNTGFQKLAFDVDVKVLARPNSFPNKKAA